PAAREDHDPRRACRGHLPRRRFGVAAEPAAARDRERAAGRDHAMTLQAIAASDAIAQLDSFDTIIDARSESEYAEDRLPGAVNWPTLNDDERRIVGTEYKQVSPFV